MATRRKAPAPRRKAVVRHIAEVLWENPPAHSPGALSKMLVRPETAGSKLVDFRVSCYQPMSYVERHAHKVQEQIYHVLEGEGLMELEGERKVVRPGHFIFIPPGVSHTIHNTGMVDLVFLVITTPPEDR
jgi:mannose-6-phosphate isomerase-like protein (cupin superfamily)